MIITMVIMKSLGERYSIFDNALYSNGTLSVELSCLYFKWLLVKLSIKYVFLSLKIAFTIPNSTDPGKISHYVPFHQCLYCLLIERPYGIQPHEMFKKQNICSLQRIPLLCIPCECNSDIELSMALHKVFCFR